MPGIGNSGEMAKHCSKDHVRQQRRDISQRVPSLMHGGDGDDGLGRPLADILRRGIVSQLRSCTVGQTRRMFDERTVETEEAEVIPDPGLNQQSIPILGGGGKFSLCEETVRCVK